MFRLGRKSILNYFLAAFAGILLVAGFQNCSTKDHELPQPELVRPL